MIERRGRQIAFSCLVALAGMGIGCASTRPVEAPEVDVTVPDAWSSPSAASPDAELPTAPAGPWWQDFSDPRLDQLIDEALVRNHDLEAVVARLDAAEARARIAGADQLPSLDAGLSAARRKQSFIGTPIPTSHSNSYGLSLNAAWEVDLWGRIRAGTVAAVAEVEAARADLAAFRLSLSGQTAKAWFAVGEALLQLELAEETAASYERTSRWVRDRYERGLRPSLDLRLALSDYESAEASATLRRLQLEDAVRQLELLLGRYPAAALAITDSLPQVSAPVPAGLPSHLLVRRPDLVAAERRIVAADARMAQAWRAQLPRLSLTGSAGTASNELSDLLDRDFSIWNIVGNLVQPLFQGGRLRAGVKLSEAEVRERAADYASLLLRAYSEVESALSTEEHLAKREGELERATEQSIAARSLARDRYRSGLEDYVTVLEAQRRALVTESLLLSVRRQRLATRVDLFMALGGGFGLDESGRPPVEISDAAALSGDADASTTHEPAALAVHRHEDLAQ
jgi:NodT family efflux transporter outer membrane factor (OMF) lipoprotein